MEVLCLSLFCYALLCVHFSFDIILRRKRKLVSLLLLSCRCIVTINFLRLFLTVPWVGLQYLIVLFPDHTHFLLELCTLQFYSGGAMVYLRKNIVFRSVRGSIVFQDGAGVELFWGRNAYFYRNL